MEELPEIVADLVRLRAKLASLPPLSVPDAIALEYTTLLRHLYYSSRREGIQPTKASIDGAIYDSMFGPQEFKRPENEAELERRILTGLWRAICFVERFGEDPRPITMNLLIGPHGHMLWSSFPESAGRMREAGEDLEQFLPNSASPTGAQVEKHMKAFLEELSERLAALTDRSSKEAAEYMDAALELAAWVQYQYMVIRPFTDGNGRSARFITNLVLIRSGLKSIPVRYEGERRVQYRDALNKIDRDKDYSLMKQLIGQGVCEEYDHELKWRVMVEVASKSNGA